MGIEILTRGAKRAYDEFLLQETQRGIDKLLFPTDDVDTSSGFLLDRLIHTPYGVVYRDKDNQSHVLPYTPGSGTLYDIPISSEKTPIDEELSDAVISGVEANSSWSTHQAKLLADIVKIHIASHNMTKWKQALDVLRTGIFYANGIGGNDINLGIDYQRAAGNSLTYDFTAGGATVDAAFLEIQDKLIDNNTPLDNIVVIMGKSWLNEFAGDSQTQNNAQNNRVNEVLTMQMMPPELRNTKGLKVVAIYRAPSMVTPFILCSYQPGTQYVAYSGATAAAWVPDNECFAFSLDDTRYNVKRGVKVKTETGRVERVAGEIVFDTYSENDPITEFLRSKTRHLFVPANINHTVKSTGTFS